jgi:hypothetical protein
MPPLPVLRKRPRDDEESPNDEYPCNDNSPRNKTAADMEADLKNESNDSSEEATASQAGD